MKIIYLILPAIQAYSFPENGYFAFNPYMGRFGNKMEQFLGAMGLAKYLDRPILLPPLYGYDTFPLQTKGREYIDFSAIFDLDKIKEFLPGSMDLSRFMQKYGATHWPQDERQLIYFGSTDANSPPVYETNSEMRDFWNAQNVSFNKFFNANMMREKDRRIYLGYTPKIYANWKKIPEMSIHAHAGNPGSFPSEPDQWHFQKHLVLSQTVRNRGFGWRKQMGLSGVSYLALHIRNASDMNTACTVQGVSYQAY